MILYFFLGSFPLPDPLIRIFIKFDFTLFYELYVVFCLTDVKLVVIIFGGVTVF